MRSLGRWKRARELTLWRRVAEQFSKYANLFFLFAAWYDSFLIISQHHLKCDFLIAEIGRAHV